MMLPPPPLVRTLRPARGGRLLQLLPTLPPRLIKSVGAKQQGRQFGTVPTVINAVSTAPTPAALHGVHGVHVHVPMRVHRLIYASARSYNSCGLIAEAGAATATAMGRRRRGGGAGAVAGEAIVHSNSCMRTRTRTLQEFDMHEYLRSLMALYRKCAMAFSSGQRQPRVRDGDVAGGRVSVGWGHLERQTVLTSQQQQQQEQESAAHIPRNSSSGSSSGSAHNPFSPSLSARAREGVATHHRRSCSTSATVFSSATAPSSSPSSSSSSSSPSPSSSPSNTTNDTTNQTSKHTSPSGRAGSIDFTRLSTLIPDQSATGVNSLWYIVATAALLAFHKEAAVGELWKYISQRCESEGEIGGVDATTRQLSIARRIRESCLKASVLVGFPRGINGLLALQSSLTTHTAPAIHTTLKSDKPLRSLLTFPSAEARYARGKHFFTQIYANHTERVLSSMSASSAGDLSYFAVSSIYGELMAEMRILDGRETVLLEFVCCLADVVGAQAKGHFFGCRNLGITGPEIRGAIEMVRELAGQLGLVSFLEEVSGEEEGGVFRFLKKAGSW